MSVVIIEGLDGVGKTTISKEIAKRVSCEYIKESYTDSDGVKLKRLQLLLSRLFDSRLYLYDRATVVDDFVYSFLNDKPSCLEFYLGIILEILARCKIYHLVLDEGLRKKRFEQRGDSYVTSEQMKKVAANYSSFYSKLGSNGVDVINLSGDLDADVNTLIERMRGMKISHIVSSDLLDLIDGRDFYMCLANIAVKDKNYRDFYKKQVEKGKFVLLDNGAAEGDQMTLDKMWAVISEINPTEVILNDCLMDGEKTIQKSKEALNFYKEKGFRGQYMFVPQGHNLSEWINCYEDMDKSDISTIGVSKFVTSGWEDSNARFKCCEYLKKDCASIHLLGCHENIKEVALIGSLFSNVRSNDTAIAYIYALSDRRVDESDRPSGSINFIKSDLTDEQVELLKHNMKIFDDACFGR